MAYFLKKSHLKKGLYLQIYESFYDPFKKNTSHKSFRSLGYVDELIASGIPDPVSFFSHEVKKLNDELKSRKELEKTRLIEESPVRYIGYFPVKNILDCVFEIRNKHIGFVPLIIYRETKLYAL